MARRKATAQRQELARDQAAHSILQFDVGNPRFGDHQFKDELEVIQYLYDQFDVDELIQSILSAGYVDFEPMVVQKGTNIVFEGNRRLAALRLIQDGSIRRKLKISLPGFDRPKQLPEQIRVRWVADRSEARAFIGFKHINGPFKWGALEKAKYAAEWFEEGGDIETISRTLGDNHNTVRRLVNGWYVLQQALTDGFDVDHTSKKKFAFSHLYTAITRTSIREMLGLTAEDVAAKPKPDPVAPEHRDDLATLMSWLYGQEQKGEAALVINQNPHLNQLSTVLAHPEAKRMLLARRDLQSAFERVEPASSRFEETLMLAAKQGEEALSLAGHYDGDRTLLHVAEGFQKTARGLLVVMKAKLSARGNQS